MEDDRSALAATALAGSRVAKVDGWSVGWRRSHSLLWAEGHPGGEERVGTAVDVAAAEASLRDVLDGGYGVNLRAGGAVSRLDACVTLRCKPREGWAILLGMAALDMPRLKPVVYGRPIETVGLLHVQGRRLLARVYDFGISRGVGERGEYVRFEDQRRFDRRARLPASLYSVERALPRTYFRRRFETLHTAARGLTVATLPSLARELTRRLDEGVITRGQFERVSATLMRQVGAPGVRPRRKGRRLGQSRATYYRHRQELRELGLALADEFLEPVEVDMARVLERALDEGAWGCG